jgi:hypothetical protein
VEKEGIAFMGTLDEVLHGGKDIRTRRLVAVVALVRQDRDVLVSAGRWLSVFPGR